MIRDTTKSNNNNPLHLFRKSIFIIGLAAALTPFLISCDGEGPILGPTVKIIDVGRPQSLYIGGTKKCLAVLNTAPQSVIQSTCANRENQTFTIRELPDGYYSLENKNGNCLEAYNNSTNNGAPIVFQPCDSRKASQKVSFRNSYLDHSFKKIVFKHSNKCLDVFEQQMLDGTPIIQWECHEGASQTILLNHWQKKDVTVPRIIWTYWNSGEKNLPPFYKANIEHWKHLLGPGWQIRVIQNQDPADENYFGKFLDPASIPDEAYIKTKIGSPPASFEKKLNPFVIFSDFVRLELLYNHGGFWIDPSVMLHTDLGPFIQALEKLDNFTIGGYTSRHQATYELRWIDSLENFFLAALPKSEFVKVWKSNFKKYWEKKQPYMAIEDNPMYNGSEGFKLDVSKYYDPSYCGKNAAFPEKCLKDYLNQHLAAKYTAETNPSLIQQVFIAGNVDIAEKGPFSLLGLVDWLDERLINMPASQFGLIANKLKNVIMSKFPSENSQQIRKTDSNKVPIRPFDYFFDQSNIFGYLNAISTSSMKASKVSKIVWGFWDKGEDKLPAFNKYAVNHWRKILEPAGYQIRILNLVDGHQENAITVLGGKDLLSKNWDDLNDVVKPYVGPDGNQVKMVPSVVRSDMIRLAVLEKFGGIWMDTSNALLQNLDSFVVEKLNASLHTVGGYVMDGYASNLSPVVGGKRVDGMENWLIAAKTGSPLIREWRKTFVKYWETRTIGQWISDHDMYKDPNFSFGGLGKDAANYLNQHAALKYVLFKRPDLAEQIMPVDFNPWWLHVYAEQKGISLYAATISPDIEDMAKKIKTETVLLKFAGGHLTEINSHFKTIDDYCNTPNLFTKLYDHCP